MDQLSTARRERQCSGLLPDGDRLVAWAMIASALISPTAMAAQTSVQHVAVQPKEPAPVTVTVGPPSPQYRLPEKLFISSGFRLMICPDAKSSTTKLQSIDRDLQNSPTLRKSGCRAANKHIKIREVLGRAKHFLAFRGEIWEAKGHLEKVYGVLDETAHSVSGYTELEDWQHRNAFFDGRLRRGPGVVKDTISCAKRSTPVELIKGRQLMDQNPADMGRLRRLEAIYSSCQPASGIFQPLAVLKRWERNGWVWTALNAQDGNGKIVSLLHSAPKPKIAP